MGCRCHMFFYNCLFYYVCSFFSLRARPQRALQQVGHNVLNMAVEAYTQVVKQTLRVMTRDEKTIEDECCSLRCTSPQQR